MDGPPGAKLDERSFVLASVAERQWERTFDAISEPLMIVDERFVVRRANLALADDLGMAVQRVVGRRCHEVRNESTNAFSGEAGSPCGGCPVPHAQRSGLAQEGEMRSRAGRVYRLRAFPLDDKAGRMTVCSYRDETEEREMSRQLANAERLASIGRLAGGVAHEINNPLGGILAFTQILMKEDVAAEERSECLREIERSALRCKAIVESLLRFSRQSPRADFRPVSLNQVVLEGMKLASYRVSLEGIDVCTELAWDLPPVLGDAGQLEQIVVNLLTNAVDSVKAVAPPGTGRIEFRTIIKDGAVDLQVADNGRGIEEEHIEKLFEPFFTTKDSGKGTGLGLAVTYAIVQEHGGQISVRNHSGGGAVFTVSLPMARA
jgi:two-component system, NtrC family, sensor kinase